MQNSRLGSQINPMVIGLDCVFNRCFQRCAATGEDPHSWPGLAPEQVTGLVKFNSFDLKRRIQQGYIQRLHFSIPRDSVLLLAYYLQLYDQFR